jgi:hypothetical protein
MVLTPGQQRPRTTQTHRIEPNFFFWLSVSKIGRMLRLLFSVAPGLVIPGVAGALYGGAGLAAGVVLGIAVGLAVYSALASRSSFRS